MAAKKPIRGARETYSCQCCGAAFEARTADRNRGWAKYCGKACAQRARALSRRSHTRFSPDRDFEQPAALTVEEAFGGLF